MLKVIPSKPPQSHRTRTKWHLELLYRHDRGSGGDSVREGGAWGLRTYQSHYIIQLAAEQSLISQRCSRIYNLPCLLRRAHQLVRMPCQVNVLS